ncbi:uncharacterized protein K441DRAFT_85331 [Cenococcum geophilum 1.58]|uniref:uncharacterized protein n=1 Tax=Cenococcum geophilum 1.58 TaxID=794803 RepID=UPI00358F5ED6|nr:hypothetical protein K441DRAFT_85331 [Cenococcum geophilum 1.58]
MDRLTNQCPLQPDSYNTLACSSTNSSQSYAPSASFSPAILAITPFNNQRLVFFVSACLILLSCVFQKRIFFCHRSPLYHHSSATIEAMFLLAFQQLSSDNISFAKVHLALIDQGGSWIPKIGAFLG